MEYQITNFNKFGFGFLLTLPILPRELGFFARHCLTLNYNGRAWLTLVLKKHDTAEMFDGFEMFDFRWH